MRTRNPGRDPTLTHSADSDDRPRQRTHRVRDRCQVDQRPLGGRPRRRRLRRGWRGRAWLGRLRGRRRAGVRWWRGVRYVRNVDPVTGARWLARQGRVQRHHLPPDWPSLRTLDPYPTMLNADHPARFLPGVLNQEPGALSGFTAGRWSITQASRIGARGSDLPLDYLDVPSRVGNDRDEPDPDYRPDRGQRDRERTPASVEPEPDDCGPHDQNHQPAVKIPSAVRNGVTRPTIISTTGRATARAECRRRDRTSGT